MYHVVICDDDVHFIHYIKDLILQAGLSEADTVFYEYLSGDAFIDDLDTFSAVDLLILDIQMPHTDGNETAEYFRRHFPLSLLVFCSGVFLPTVHSFETSPFRYLLKEYSDTRMLQELKAIVSELLRKKTEPYIFATHHNTAIRVKSSEIQYISIGRNCTQIHISPEINNTCYDGSLTCKQKLPELYNLLKDYNFAYAHNSYIVNLAYVKRKNSLELELMDGTILTISRSKEKEFRTTFAKYMAKKY